MSRSLQQSVCMDINNKFPHQLFPLFYVSGPPDVRLQHEFGGYGTYERLLESGNATQCGKGRPIPAKFQPQNKVNGELWIPTEPIVTPVLTPFNDDTTYSAAVNPDNFHDQMKYFYLHHYLDSFSVMGQLLNGHFSFGKIRGKNPIKMELMNNFIDNLKYKKCEREHYSVRANRYHHLLGDVMSDIPSSLLAELLHEELVYQRAVEHFQPAFTGGALGYISFGENHRDACLICPTTYSSCAINFHHVVMEYSEGKAPNVNIVNKPQTYTLNGAVRQVTASRTEEVNIGVRTDHFCAAFKMKDGQRPRPLEVVQLKERTTCINVSPHLSRELVVASESGAAYLWTVGKCLQKVRDQNSNLYLNANSPWRWCEFTAHPKVIVYADQTGADITDMRTGNSHALFQIGKTADCKIGERLFLSKYIGESHAYHHLITTQFSAYIIDERMPHVPALKWMHMMRSPPCYAHVIPPAGQSSTSKILLGAQKEHETFLLQYSGGKEFPCQADGPVQKLCSPSESLRLWQLPHKHCKVEQRLAIPATGLAAVQNNGFLCVFQLTEAGDIFYQALKHVDRDNQPADPAELTSQAPAPVDEETSNINCSIPLKPGNFEAASKELMLKWKNWLDTLSTLDNKQHLDHKQIKTSNIITFNRQKQDKLDQDKFQSLRNNMIDILKNKKMLVQGATYLPSLEVSPFLDLQNDDLLDDLSNRLSASWDGGWRYWWDDKLGLNKEDKIEALRRKRQSEKRARAHKRFTLSGSFTSSAGYLDNPSEFSFGASQQSDSDTETVVSSQRTEKNVTFQPDVVPDSTVLNTEWQNHKESSEVTEPIKSLLKSQKNKTILDALSKSQPTHPEKKVETEFLNSRLRLRPHQQNSLNSVFSSQVTSQDHEQGDASVLTMLQPSTIFVRSSSQIRMPQPQKKRSRMGF